MEPEFIGLLEEFKIERFIYFYLFIYLYNIYIAHYSQINML